ncbi:MAG: tetratricopeptide repeat protein [Sedimenticola sp.]
MVDQNDDPLALYRADQPLSEEELGLISTFVEHEVIDPPQTIQKDNEMFLAEKQVVDTKTLFCLDKVTTKAYSNGEYNKAVLAATLALRLGLIGLSEKHPDTLSSLNNLAGCLQALGRAGESLPLFEQALAGHREVLGNKHPCTLESLHNLACCLETLGCAREALPLYEQALADCREVLGDKHSDALTNLNNLAGCLVILGHAGKAQPLYEQALKGRREVLGDEHPNSLISLKHLGSCLRTLGRSGESLPLFEQALTGNRKVLGDKHPETLSSLNNLAECLITLGHARDALPLLEQALEHRREVLGDKHPHTLTSLNNLAGCLKTLGRAGEAVPLYEQALADRREVLGDQHPHTLTCRNNLALCLQTLGRAKEALPIHEQILTDHRKVLGDKHPETLETLNNLACSLNSIGRAQEALPFYRQSLEGRREVLGAQHPGTLASLNNLAICMATLGEAHRALLLHAQALEGYYETLGDQHPDTLTCLFNMAMFCFDQRDAERVATYVPAFLHAVATTPFRNGNWYSQTTHATELSAPLIRKEQLPDWDNPFAAISRHFQEDLDLAEDATRERLLPHFQKVHYHWLHLAIHHQPDAIPDVLAAIQGRDLAALMLEELQRNEDDFPEGDPRRRYIEISRELRRKKLELQLLSGGLSGSGSEPGSGDRSARPLDTDQLATRREQLEQSVNEYEAMRSERQSLGEAIAASDNGFALSRGYMETNPAALGRGLDKNEALVLLFPLPSSDEDLHGREAPSGIQACLLHEGRVAGVLNLGQLEAQQQALLDYEQAYQHYNRSALRLLGDDQPAPVRGNRHPASSHLASLTGEVGATFWQPLLEALPGVSRWHLATHGGLHGLPLELGVPDEHEMHLYPGLIFFYQRQHLDDPLPERQAQPRTLGVHTDPALDAGNPIPFVEVDRQAVAHLWEQATPCSGEQSRSLWVERESPLHEGWYFGCHGDVEKGPPKQTVLLLDASQGTRLDMSAVLSGVQRPRVVVLGACVVGQVHDDPLGEPLGLVSGFLLRGADYVVAPVQGMPDFYMPLFTLLFHQAWMALGEPARALDETKRRLQTGGWYEDTAKIAKAAYRPVILEELERALEDDKALDRLHGWPLSDDIRHGFLPDEAAFREECIGSPEEREAFANQLLAQFDDPAGLPREPIMHLCTWIRGFGRSRML